MADIKPTGADYGLSYANAGISVVQSIAGALLSTRAFETQLKAVNDNKIANMNTVMNNYEYESAKLNEDYALMDSMFADKVSERTLQGMKDFATMKAASAETGTTGGSTNEAVIQAHADTAFDIAIINQKRRSASYGAVKKMESSKLDAINAIESLASGNISFEANAFLDGVSGFSAALGGLVSTMPKNVTAEILGFGLNANQVDVMNSKGGK